LLRQLAREKFMMMNPTPFPAASLSERSLRTVCGLDELGLHGRSGLTHVLSILDPDYPTPEVFRAYDDHDKLELRFHDAIESSPGIQLPTEADVAAILKFGAKLSDRDDGSRAVLVHCHVGISRSTAAMAMLIAQTHPEADEAAVFQRLIEIRPRAWPNSLMIEFADNVLGRGGRLIESLAGLYRAQIPRIPDIANYMREHGRASEYEMARL
jgi:predicted protein tyrosine phosphatase